VTSQRRYKKTYRRTAMLDEP